LAFIISEGDPTLNAIITGLTTETMKKVNRLIVTTNLT